MSERESAEHAVERSQDGAALWRLKELFSKVIELSAQDREAFLQAIADTQTREALRGLLRADSALAAMTARSAVQRIVSAHADAEHAPANVGGFSIQRMLGRGGMGTVYLAERAVPGGLQRIALKCLHPIGAATEFERRFHSEISVLAQLSHPHIARLIDAGQETDGRCWIAMEFIEGMPLLQYCDERGLTLPARLALFDTLCEAVSAAHRNLVVHRDLKSSNVLVREDGELFLIDFGIARPLSAVDDVTQAEQRFISPLNAAPEQIRGEPTTTACDVYGLGVILYELLCGVPPIEPGTASGEAVRVAVFHQIPLLASTRLRQLARSEAERAQGIARNRACADVSRLARSVHGDLEQVCAVALRKEPHERYASVDQLREDLTRATSGQPILARGNDRLYRSGRWLRRHVIALSFATAAALALVGGMTVLWLQANTLEQERDHARAQTHLAQQQGQRAEFLTTFLLDAFEQADPSRTMGEKLSAKQILDAGVRQLRDANDIDAESRIRFAITLATVEYHLGLYSAGNQLIDLNRTYMAELPNPPARLLASQRLIEGTRAIHESKFAQARDDADAGLALLGEIDDASSERLWLALKRMRNEALVSLADHKGSVALLRELVAALPTLHWIRRADAWDLRMSLAHSLNLVNETRAEARSILNAVLQEQAAAHAEDTPISALALRMLASVEIRSGEAHVSRLTAEKSLAIFRQVYGEEHPVVARALNQLAVAEMQDSRIELALQHFEEASQILARTSQPDMLSVGIQFNLGINYNGIVHDNVKAEKYLRDALAGFRTLLGNEHMNAIITETNLAGVLLEQRRYSEVEPLLQHALHFWEQHTDQDPGGLSEIQAEFASLRHAQGHDQEARELLQKCMPTLQKHGEAGSPIMTRALALAKTLHVE